MTTYQPPTTAEKLQALPWAWSASAANSIFVQFVFFGPAFVLFLDELSISRTGIGFLLSLVPFTGLVALFIVPAVARFGYKRTFIVFWGSRKVISCFLLLVPFVSARFGLQAAVLLITFIMIGFSLCRAIAETGYYPWLQEYVPTSVRGKFSATNTSISSFMGILATTVATFVIGFSDDISRFMVLFALGIIAGGVSVVFYSRIPGGASTKTDANSSTVAYRDLFGTLKDNNLAFFLGGIALFTFGTGPLYSFLPLFMRQEIGLTDSNVFMLQISILVGGLISAQLLGWSADRYGSKPVMISGIALAALLPMGWILMPRMSSVSLVIALILAFLKGATGVAWAVGSGRLLFTRIVPEKRKAQYMAMYYAGIGLIGGTSQFLGGILIDAFSGVSGQLGFISLDAFTVLMVLSIILPLLSLLVFGRVQSDSRVSVAEFARMFTHGNPVFALSTMARFYRARDVTQAVLLTERLGQTNSPLMVNEMLDALADARFYVRFEAVISIARMDPTPELTQALIDLLNGTELSLSVMAAWALGRIGDESALPALRAALNSEFKSIRAHCIRALGALGDTESITVLLDQLKSEDDTGLQVAYASTLANLGAVETIPTLFELTYGISNDKARMEIVMAMATMVSDEQHFVGLVRGLHNDPGTTIAQELMHVRSRLTRHGVVSASALEAYNNAIKAYGNGDLQHGTEALIKLIEDILVLEGDATVHQLLQGSLNAMKRWSMQRPEYVLLALNILHES